LGVPDKSRPGKLKKKYISPDYHNIMVTLIVSEFQLFFVEREFEFIVVVFTKESP